MKAMLLSLSLLVSASVAQADQNGAAVWNLLTNAPRAEDVEDDGGFDSPHFIESKLPGQEPTLIEPNQVWDTLLLKVANRRVCDVETSPCEGSSSYYDSIKIYVDLAGNSAGQTLTVVGDGDALWSTDISTGVSGHRTTPGTYRLRDTNGGRLYDTRNHCSGVAEYGRSEEGVTYLAPMPYAVHFNGGEALHAGYVTGEPESHGCVRQPREYARKLYCLLTSQKNWSRTTVYVQ